MIQRECPITRVTPDDERHYFFGYYDKNPWSADGSTMLCHRVGFADRFPAEDDAAEIGLVDPSLRTFERIGTTRAWNWQQGAQLQWLGEQRLLFNDRRDGTLVSVIMNADGSDEVVVPEPVYTVSPRAGFALAVSYGRLTRLRREYGIPGILDEHDRDPAPADDGIWRIDLRTGDRRLIVSFERLEAHRPDTAGGERHQHVNHLMINPSATRFCFMHRYEREGSILHSRLFTAALDGSDLRLLMEGMCSHYDWRDDETILAWAGRRSLLGSVDAKKTPKQRLMGAARRTLKPIYYALGKPRILMSKIMKDSYVLIPDREEAELEPFAAGELTCDGHCTHASDGRWVLTDGYPDMRSRQPLFLWDTAQNQGFEVGRYPTPREMDGETRVDLHPRFNSDASRVCIDSAMSGRRAMYVVDVSGITNA